MSRFGMFAVQTRRDEVHRYPTIASSCRTYRGRDTGGVGSNWRSFRTSRTTRFSRISSLPVVKQPREL
jgi:hypothetical protein